VADEARHVATMKTIRQVKTVFVIFVAFVCCWSPYIVVLLYDDSDSLPLSVHVYASMLAHLHASLNFAIYGLRNRAHYRRYCSRIVAAPACCLRRPTPRDGASNVLYSPYRPAGGVDVGGVNRALVNVEYHRTSQSKGGCRDDDDDVALTSNTSWRPLSVSTEEEHF